MKPITVNLAGKTALVTGASRGIGAAIAKQLAVSGANVALSYHSNRAQAQRVQDEICELCQAKTLLLQGDVADSSQFPAWFAEIEQKMDVVDILINNASDEYLMDALAFTDDNWDRIQAVNVRAPLRLAQQVVQKLKTRNQAGVVLNISSIHDTVARKGFAHYTSSKAALLMLTKNLALEWAEHNVRVLALSPGAVETDRNRDEIAKVGVEKFCADIPIGRVADADEMAAIVTFLVSDYCAYMTGTTVYADGGYKENVIPHDPRKLD